MHVTLVHVVVKPGREEAFLDATRTNHERSVEEPGNLRFDVLRSHNEPARFVLYEAYLDEEAARAHKETTHYAEWRDAVADLMAEPRAGVRYDGLFPRVEGPGLS
jgi:(4S)-4-hydroxy-5-phosphonooxypentane-2,3-dione isomerase